MSSQDCPQKSKDKLIKCRSLLRAIAQKGPASTVDDLKQAYDSVVEILDSVPKEEQGTRAVESLSIISHMLSSAAKLEMDKIAREQDYEMEPGSPTIQMSLGVTECKSSCGNSQLNKISATDSRERFDDFSEARKAAIENTIVKNLETLPLLTDIAGLTEAKNALNEALVDPILYPEWFTKTDLKPWKSVLLYGPPGTGKTALCHAAAREIKATLYQISSSDLISSWSGQSEKLIRELFDHAIEQNKVVVIFIDEVDSLCRMRSSSEDDSNRRVKTELLVQIQRLQQTCNIMLVCATNCPWDLDPAFLRRFEKKIYVGLPSLSARVAILRKKLAHTARSPAVSLEWLSTKTEGFSGDDLRRFASEVAYAQFRRFKEQKALCKSEAVCNPVTVGLIESVLSNFLPTVDESQLAKFQQYMNK